MRRPVLNVNCGENVQARPIGEGHARQRAAGKHGSSDPHESSPMGIGFGMESWMSQASNVGLNSGARHVPCSARHSTARAVHRSGGGNASRTRDGIRGETSAPTSWPDGGARAWHLHGTCQSVPGTARHVPCSGRGALTCPRTRGTPRRARGPCARNRSAGTCRPFRGSARCPNAPCARRQRPRA